MPLTRILQRQGSETSFKERSTIHVDWQKKCCNQHGSENWSRIQNKAVRDKWWTSKKRAGIKGETRTRTKCGAKTKWDIWLLCHKHWCNRNIHLFYCETVLDRINIAVTTKGTFFYHACRNIMRYNVFASLKTPWNSTLKRPVMTWSIMMWLKISYATW